MSFDWPENRTLCIRQSLEDKLSVIFVILVDVEWFYQFLFKLKVRLRKLLVLQVNHLDVSHKQVKYDKNIHPRN